MLKDDFEKAKYQKFCSFKGLVQHDLLYLSFLLWRIQPLGSSTSEGSRSEGVQFVDSERSTLTRTQEKSTRNGGSAHSTSTIT